MYKGTNTGNNGRQQHLSNIFNKKPSISNVFLQLQSIAFLARMEPSQFCIATSLKLFHRFYSQNQCSREEIKLRITKKQ